ncbi:8-oxo-dGTP diphosphatase [Fistulifera solaris]|uniref:Oxidized purine nucleoside triphosphate hydrolase n=1 Tax=Fistulifera solaris TaxID=1519565 RepID=A0A1Z5KCW7_FISSO|nr:8-oxo-dGTP diphosphatase [Fistulifera solaris]|eukprot:GAX23768.1 8-oxo-dGTP diphosphatase [Fistulifera solaris]
MGHLRLSDCRKKFINVLPEQQLGEEHSSLDSFRKAVKIAPRNRKEFSLIVLTNENRILIGLKHRGFGKGMFNSFGGKLEKGEDPVVAACRELHEETGISVTVKHMTESKIGILHFTFEDDPVEMCVHLFRVNVSCCGHATDKADNAASEQILVDPLTIRGCDEITPEWIENFYHIPLHNMFADDSIWLTFVLASKKKVVLDGWFHFLAGGQEVNTIHHHFVDIKTDPKSELPKSETMTLEKRLFHRMHSKSIISPSPKEFNEAWAFSKVVKKSLRCNELDCIIDVAGGHGALAAILLITTAATRAIVVDPAQVGRDSVRKAWADFFPEKELRYRHECLRSGLPAELELALKATSRDRILVVACHACQHLSDETVKLSCKFGVHVCVMPCCQKDPSTGSSWKAFSKNVSFPIEQTMDILLAGKAMSWNTGQEAGVRYDVRIKFIDSKITPQNRVIVCRSSPNDGEVPRTEKSHRKLQQAYRRAHKRQKSFYDISKLVGMHPSLHLVGGFILGALTSALLFRTREKINADL